MIPSPFKSLLFPEQSRWVESSEHISNHLNPRFGQRQRGQQIRDIAITKLRNHNNNNTKKKLAHPAGARLPVSTIDINYTANVKSRETMREAWKISIQFGLDINPSISTPKSSRLRRRINQFFFRWGPLLSSNLLAFKNSRTVLNFQALAGSTHSWSSFT